MLNRVIPLVLITFLALNTRVKGQVIVPGGYVSGSWDQAHSPYLVDGDLLVDADSTLMIGEGTEVLFRGQYRLEIQGQLLVQGTTASPVVFSPDEGIEHWGGIHFNSTDTSITDSSLLEHGLISDCYQYSCLNITYSGRIRVSDFTIRNGTSFRGGGIMCRSSDPLFENLLVENNVALDGAGISLEGSSPVMKDCTIRQNTADGAGGGMVIFDSSNPVMINCTVTANQSFGSGGGLYINASSPVFKGCLINYNLGAVGASNLYSGGGVSVKLGCSPRFENCTFANNISYREGGAIASFSPNQIIDCLFSANTAGTFGGAVFISSANLIVSNLNNCTFSDNDAPGGTAFATHNHMGVLRNCILWHASPSNPASLIRLDAPFSWNVLDAAYSDIQNGENGIENTGTAHYTWGAGNIDLDPVFLDGSFELSWQSPCIETGTPDTTGLMLPLADLAGNPRLVNQRVDMGAYEYQMPVIIPDSRFQIPENIQVFPNPVKDWVYIDFHREIQNASCEVISSNGEIVLNGRIAAGEGIVEIDLSGIAAGIYVIIVQADSVCFSKKVIKSD